MIKILKHTSLAFASLMALCSCSESLPEDCSAQFAANVVYHIYSNSLLLPIADISTMHKASAWLEHAEDDNLRYEIEDLYFSKVAPRKADNIVYVITPNENIVINVEHNNIPIDQAGAQWVIKPESSISGKKITLNNIDGKVWSCTQEEPAGAISLSFEIECTDIDNYNISLEGSKDIIYVNSPIVGQRFESFTQLAYRSPYVPPYPIGTLLDIVDGSLTIELLSDSGEVVAGDNIDVTFKSNDGLTTSTYQDYNYRSFNPLIKFRDNTFYYQDYNNFCYY
ncbi:MAG: hypothetical protein R3Y08_05200 [Rikenellaceae bacterium]